MPRWLWIVLIVIVGVPVLTAAIGLLLPRDHVARLSISLAASPERVWAMVSNFAATPDWRPDVTMVEMAPQTSDGPLRFTETSANGKVPFELVSQTAPVKQVVRVVDDDQPFGGTWTWELEPSGSGTRLTITEAGFIKNPIFRTMGLLFFSPTKTIDGYMRALATALGETVVPVPGDQ